MYSCHLYYGKQIEMTILIWLIRNKPLVEKKYMYNITLLQMAFTKRLCLFIIIIGLCATTYKELELVCVCQIKNNQLIIA